MPKEGSKPTVIDLCSGAGLQGGAWVQAGYNINLAVDLDANCVESYRRNVAPSAVVADVGTVRSLRCDVLLAGPPCQGFSTLGRQNPDDARNLVSLAIADWAATCGPRVVVVENVPPFLLSPSWQRLARRLGALGYEVGTWVLDATDFGVAQRRRRAFTVASRVGMPECPGPTTPDHSLTVREAWDDLPGPSDPMGAPPRVSGTALARIELVPPGGDKRDILRRAPGLCPPSWAALGAQATDVWGRMAWDQPSNTIRCHFQDPTKGRYLHPQENRPITLREGARLQGVPDAWTFAGRGKAIARQIGNGVPLPLARAVADAVRPVLG